VTFTFVPNLSCGLRDSEVAAASALLLYGSPLDVGWPTRPVARSLYRSPPQSTVAPWSNLLVAQ